MRRALAKRSYTIVALRIRPDRVSPNETSYSGGSFAPTPVIQLLARSSPKQTFSHQVWQARSLQPRTHRLDHYR